MNEKVKKGCNEVFKFFKDYWLVKMQDTEFDPSSPKSNVHKQESLALAHTAVQYGAAMANNNFSKNPRKLMKEFAFYLTKKHKMSPDRANVMAEIVDKSKKTMAWQKFIQSGKEEYQMWK